MKVEKLYEKCKELIENGHAKYDVTIEMEGDKDQRELIDDTYVISFKHKDIGLLVLRTDRPLQWL